MRLLLLLLFGSVVMYTSCQSTSAPIDSLAARVTENTSKGQILFRLVTDEADPAKDYFEIDSKDDKGSRALPHAHPSPHGKTGAYC